jgi:isochorismate synthase EntC
MTTSSNAAAPAGAAAWVRRSAPSGEHVRALLQTGAVFAWSDDRWFIAWGEPRRAARPDPRQPSFYTPDFLLSDPQPWRVYPSVAAVPPDALAQQLTGAASGRTWTAFDEDAFRRVFARVQAARERGEIRKAVPAVFERSAGPLSAEERARALRALANLPAGLMPYGCWDAAGGVLGASPEILFEDDGVEIHTMAVAGTARAGAAPDEMLDDPKERAEHRFVLEDLAAQLAPLGGVTRGATRLWRIGMLSHLRTDLRLAARARANFDELVSRLHPTPAVGTAPRRDWRTFIPGLDSEPRGRFAAPFGLLLPDGTARCLVAIRHVEWDRHGARCGAGCGLVEGSRAEREISELRLKLAATRGNLGL